MNKVRASFLTMITSWIAEFVSIFLSLYYTKALLSTFGSSVNGLIATLNQFIAFFKLLEGGFTTAAIVALYNPMVKKDYKRISDVLCTIKRILLRVGFLISGLVLLIGIVYIQTIDSPYTLFKTYILLSISLLGTFLNVSILAKHSLLISADNKGYIGSLFSIVPKIVFRLIAIYVMLNYKVDITIIYLIDIIEILVHIGLLKLYELKNYKNISYDGEYNPSLIKGTKDIFLQKIASTVFTSTDLVLISSYISLAASSVYHLYSQTFSVGVSLLSSTFAAPSHSFGQIVQSEDENNRAYKVFTHFRVFSLLFTTVILASLSSIILPFIRIYTQKIVDIDYINYGVLLLFYACKFSQMVNRPYGMILNVTGNFKLQNIQCIVAAVVNLVVSILLVRPLKLVGILIGSLLGYLIIMFANIYQANTKVFSKNMVKEIAIICINFAFGLVFINLSNQISFLTSNYFLIGCRGILMFIVCSLLCIAMNLLLDYRETKEAILYFLSSIRKKLLRKTH